MSTTKIEGASVDTKANVYFDGKVISHTLRLGDGSRKTLGLIYPGEYHFGTDRPEHMEIVAGTCRVRRDGEADWTLYAAGTAFEVPGTSSFDIAVESGLTEYICTFL